MGENKNPTPMSIQELLQWFEDQQFAPDTEIGKRNYAYADPVADAHNQRDSKKKLHWEFSNIHAYVWDEEHNVQIEIELDEAYTELYELLAYPDRDDFSQPLIASALKEALTEVLSTL